MAKKPTEDRAGSHLICGRPQVVRFFEQKGKAITPPLTMCEIWDEVIAWKPA